MSTYSIKMAIFRKMQIFKSFSESKMTRKNFAHFIYQQCKEMHEGQRLALDEIQVH